MARSALPILLLLAACSGATSTPVPANSSRLSVSVCSKTVASEADTYATELRSTGELRLFVDPELTRPMGGVATDTVFGREYSPTVWAILVNDFNDDICEAYIGADNVEPVNP